MITVKLHAYGVDHDSFKLTRSCFSDQRQSMKLDSVFNSCFQINTGVPQDSIFGSVAGEKEFWKGGARRISDEGSPTMFGGDVAENFEN